MKLLGWAEDEPVPFTLKRVYDRSTEHFPTADELVALRKGQRLVQTFMVLDKAGKLAKWSDVAAGKYDADLTARLREVKGYPGGPHFFGLHHEPTNDQTTCGTASDYVKAWRHVHDLGIKLSISVRWFWCLMASNFGAKAQAPAADWYPGDRYIDVVGADGYNWCNCLSGTVRPANSKSFPSIFEPVAVFAVAHGKQVLVGEYGTVVGAPDRDGWLQDALETIRDDQRYLGACYWNNDARCNWLCDEPMLGVLRQAKASGAFA